MRTAVFAASLVVINLHRLSGQSATPLAELVSEAEHNNPGILAADHDWRAATHVRQQVTTLPDPQFTVQEFSVGSPKPLAGITTSNFAYFGIGATQELPYPGKLRAKGLAADRSADAKRAVLELARSFLGEQVKTAYLRLAYLKHTLELLDASRFTLGQLVEGELARYSTGLGSQTQVLTAQMARMKLVREITGNHEQMAELQVDLKKLLNRAQTSTDIVPEDLQPKTLRYNSRELLAFVEKRNPNLQVSGREIEKGQAEIQSAERSGKPDFSIGYMYERTGSNFPAYYMVTVGLTLPRRRRVDAILGESLESLRSAQARLQSEQQEQEAEVQKQFVAMTGAEEILLQFREGLIPQADTAFQSTLAAYGSNREGFASVLNALNSVFELKRDYAQELLAHELALVRLETLTGEALR